MLQQLSIKNIVLIEQCDIGFARGLCVLTGETGAGKSILLDALGLALGSRAETRLIRYGKDQASVTAHFDISKNNGVKASLEDLGLEPSEEMIIRRTLTSDGKTKCFINDVAVSVTALKTLGDKLIEVHGQHDGRGLLDPATHREMLDLYGELEIPLQEVETAYRQMAEARNALKEAHDIIEKAMREKDYLLHMQKELSAMKVGPGEETELADKRTTMMQSEKLATTLQDVTKELNIGKGVTAQLSSAQRILARSPLRNDSSFSSAIDALERAGNEVAEAERLIEGLLRASQYNPDALEVMEERLFAIRALARKYNVSADELPVLLAEVDEKLGSLSNQEHQIGTLQQKVKATKVAYLAFAETLSGLRIKAARKLEEAVADELESLKMAATQFHIMLEKQPEDKWSGHGIDAIQFQAATNKGANLAPLNKIASGGELSRFMLAMKVALAKVKSTGSLIFDEIDTGTGGAVADAIGKRLAKLGESHQVLVVTHLPQVAARGTEHLHISKQEILGETFTTVKVLNPKERTEELARMLSGAEITPEARRAAGKLLQH